MITAAVTGIILLILVWAIIFFGCYSAMYMRFQNTGFEKHQHLIPMALALMRAVYLNSVHGVTEDNDDLVEMVAGFYLYGYTNGQAAFRTGTETRESEFVAYARRCEGRSYHFRSTLVWLMKRSYAKGRMGEKIRA